MRLFATLFFCLITSLAIAADTVYVSSLTNGTPPTLNVARFFRPASGPFNPQGAISLILAKPGGVTSIQPNGDTQLHVYRTEQVGNKARVVRETVDLTTFTFVVGSTVNASTVNYPANLASIHNMDSNDALTLVQKQTGRRLHTRPLNPAGNLTGGFRGLPTLPAAPFGARISDGKPFFFSALWIEPVSKRTGITFANITAPAKSTSFLFTKPILAHDVSLSFPREDVASKEVDPDVSYYFFLYYETNVTPEEFIAAVFVRKFIRATTGLDGQIRVADFRPTGNAIRISPSRSIGSASNVTSFQFNGVGIDPLAVAIAFLRWNPAQNTNEILLQTFNPVAGRKVGPPKFVKRAVRNYINYGISVFNAKFKNGVTAD